MAPTEKRFDGFPMAVLVEGGLAVVAVLLAWLFRVPLREQIAPLGPPLAWAVARGVAATLPMLAAFWWLMHSPRPSLRNLRQQVEWLIGEMFPTGSIAQLGLVALLAGVSEELLFRGVLQTKLGQWTSPAVGLVITSLLFGLAHALSKLYFVLATTIGLFFGCLVLRYNDLVAPMIAHGLYDFVALVYLSRCSARRAPQQIPPDSPTEVVEHEHPVLDEQSKP